MSGVVTALEVRKLGPCQQGRQTWKLLQPLVYQSDKLGRHVTVPAGFVTDYASVPRLPFAFWLAGDTAHEAAVVHDWLYTSHEVDRATADAVFAEAMRVSDPRAPAGLMWLAVRVAGGGSWNAPGPAQPPMVRAVLDERDRQAA